MEEREPHLQMLEVGWVRGTGRSGLELGSCVCRSGAGVRKTALVRVLGLTTVWPEGRGGDYLAREKIRSRTGACLGEMRQGRSR